MWLSAVSLARCTRIDLGASLNFNLAEDRPVPEPLDESDFVTHVF